MTGLARYILSGIRIALFCLFGVDEVFAVGVAQSAPTQSFDAAGRRWKLEGAGPERTFAYRADGLLNYVKVGSYPYSASFGDNGLLTGRHNPFRSVTVQTRDSLGRITDIRTKTGGKLSLKETVPQWSHMDKIFGLYSERICEGAWNEYRDFQYDYSRRLVYEDFTPWSGSGDDVLPTRFDGQAWAATGGIGVRTQVDRSSDAIALHEVPSVGTFGRVGTETLRIQPRPVSLSGASLGVDQIALALDSRSVSPVTHGGRNDATGNWTASALLAPGYHYLTATATHFSGWQPQEAESLFRVAPQPETVTNTYDEMGNVASRVWSGGRSQALTWDGFGRLIKVVESGVYEWKAFYDGLGRRIRTTYTPNAGVTVTVYSVFDPEVEFLELGTGVQMGAGTVGWNWRVYGPDLSESYGGNQGQGGLEAIIGADGITRGIVSDWNGNAVGWVDKPGASITWSPAQYLAWGPAPGWGTMPQDGTKPLYQLIGYRGLTVDPPGYLQHGLRAYDPSVGRWLSPDPMGHEGSLSLYDYCDNDPLNVSDPDGRFGKQPLSHYSIQAQAQVSSMFRGSQYTGGPVYATRGSPYASSWDKMSHGQQVSTVLNFVPGVGTVKSLFEGMTGRDFIAGRDLSTSEQVLSAGMGIASIVGSTATFAGAAARGGSAVSTLSRSAGSSLPRVSAAPKAGGLLRQTGGGGAFNAADDAYAAIRRSTTDVAEIAESTGIKASNIQKVKDHVFMNEHLLDRYVDYGVPAVTARFDSSIEIANAWQRLRTGTHTTADINLLKHETAEAWFMRRHGPGYNAAHDAAQNRFPWQQ